MIFSAINENYLKTHLNDVDKTESIATLTKQIEEIEKDMLIELNTGYLNVINKCSKLESLTNKIQNICIIITDLYAITNEFILKSSNASDEKSMIEKALVRLDEVKHELSLIKKFILLRIQFPNLKFHNTESFIPYFDVTQNLKIMNGMLHYFKKYNFYMSLYQIYRDMHTEFVINIKDTIHYWLTNLNHIQIGSSISLNNYKSNIFDCLSMYRRQLITIQFLDVTYAAKILEIEPLVIETINNKRFDLKFTQNNQKTSQKIGTISSQLNHLSLQNQLSEHPVDREEHPNNILDGSIPENKTSIEQLDRQYIQRNQPIYTNYTEHSELESIIYSLISNALLSYFLKEFYSGIRTYYDDIFDEIDKLQFHDFKVLKHTLLLFKKICTILYIDTEKLDQTISRVGNELFGINNEIKNPITFFYKFIDDALEFLQETTQHDNELNDMLAISVDKKLKKYYYDQDIDNTDVFVTVKEDIKKVLSYLKQKQDFFEIHHYEIENIIYLKEETFVKDKVDDILNSNDIKDIVKKIVNLKTFMDNNTKQKIIYRIEKKLESKLQGDDLILFKDTIQRNFANII